ncbi:MAG: glutamine-hydrolyzing GMP synthase [Chitinophagales bacterium]|nr:glutamine-hydrolyzing GMP synthase [Chitinophagales bacterium]MDW8418087.1 glutamine-hydrolyzing GMP synthase [Chitinophagales bacterium]
MTERILIIDFGSQYTQLIARRIRESEVYCEIYPYHHLPSLTEDIKGVILSGSPSSVKDKNAPTVDVLQLLAFRPVLGVCYGAQLLAHNLGGVVEKSRIREYGRAQLHITQKDDVLFNDVQDVCQVWMSHGDTIQSVGDKFETIATSENIPIAAFRSKAGVFANQVYALQFHPEVYHSTEGHKILNNFLFKICGCGRTWTPGSFVEQTVRELRAKIGNEKVILALSGGVDSSVAALLLEEAIGENLICVFVDNGLLRKYEFETVMRLYEEMGLQVTGVRAAHRFLQELKGVEDPETKRKIIGRVFIEVFEHEAHKHPEVKWLAQGTIYPDVIESISVKGPSATIKSHHNVGGLPERLKLKIVEPLRNLFKDEVRKAGKELGLVPEILYRHPFPGPGLAVRILGEVTAEKVQLLQEADHIFIENLKMYGLYNQVWQAGAILTPIRSVGVMGDERTYENVIALRAVNSTDGMTADWSQLPYDFLAKTSNDIINQVRGVNRVVYDISSKPPATIEWE